MVSHALSTASAISLRSLSENALLRIGLPASSLGAIAVNAMVSQAEPMAACGTRNAGAPETMPSNSSGRRWAAINP